MLKKFFLCSMTIAAPILAQATASRACSVCLTGTSDPVVDGYNASVLFLMATPYLVVGSIVGGLVFTYRRARKHSEKAEQEEAPGLIWKQEDSGR